MPNNSSANGATRRAPRRTTGSGLPTPTGSNPLQGGTGNPDSKTTQKAKQLLMTKSQLEILQNNLRIAELFINSSHLEMLSPTTGNALHINSVCEISPGLKSTSGIVAYRVTKVMYNEEENSYEKLVSVYSALNSIGGVTAMILQSDGVKVDLYMCTNTSGNAATAGELLYGNLKGQFPGCEITKLGPGERDALLFSIGGTGSYSSARTVRSLSMIPSRREDERQHDKEYSAQGYEKFIDAMMGRKYTLVVLSQAVPPDAMDGCRNGMESLYTMLSPYAKETVTFGENESDSINYSVSNSVNQSFSKSISRSFGTSHTSSISNGRSGGRGSSYNLFDVNFSSNSGWSTGTSTSDTSSVNQGTGEATSQGEGISVNDGGGSTTGTTRSLTINRDNKAVQNLLAKVEGHIKRINTNQTFGMWSSCAYIIADDVATATMGTSTIAAIFSGDSEVAPRAYCNQWDSRNPVECRRVLDYLQALQHPVVELAMKQRTTDASGNELWIPGKAEKLTPAMMISGKEIPTLMSLPRKSVPGIVVDQFAEFGRNVSDEWKKKAKRPIPFGNIYHMGRVEPTMAYFDLDTFASHTFICGASGSGKSNTTYNLLQILIDKKIPFLVIEPAKGEYKIEFAGLPGVNIFTADETAYQQLQLNPFEFGGGIHIREHLDNLIQVVSACWPLYGAMPAILKQAFEQVYIEHGWDLDHSERIVNRGTKFPVFKDMIPVLQRIINESEYSAQAKGDYKGALVTRVSSLCNGFEGQIFGRNTGISESTLFQANTIIDLSSIGSDETRALIMGLLITKLKNYRKAASGGPNRPLCHVTVLEEAHNILKRCSHDTNAESGNIQGAAVGRLCGCIAEMRSSGEGFMIIDQSPGAVDEAAIKNTAIKIAMRLPSKDDCEAIGAALSLDEAQMKELSRLDIGVAAVFHAGWTDTVLAKMGNIWDKRYQISAVPRVDKTVYTQVQGAVIQLMYHALCNGMANDMYTDVRDLVKLLCQGKTKLTPELPVSKQNEILETVQVFCVANASALRSGNMTEITRLFAEFVMEFLKLRGVFKVFPLSGVPEKASLDPLKPKEARAVLRWEKELRQGICRYLFMPMETEPAKAYRWPADPTAAEYFWPIYKMILGRYAKAYPDYRYSNAFEHLDKMNLFSPKRGGL